MFDIGFWEIAVIAVVALMVVGPDEFPALVRNIGGWIGKIRQFMSDTKNDLDREFSKVEELKQLVEREASLAKLHEQVDARKIGKDMIDIDRDTAAQADVPPPSQAPATAATPAIEEPPPQISPSRPEHGSNE